MSLSTVKAYTWGEYDFVLDYSTGNPYSYSRSLEKYSSNDVEVGYENCDCSENYDFTCTALPYAGADGLEHDNEVVGPGSDVYISVPWFNSGTDSVVLRGESNYDVEYSVVGFWTSEP